MVRMSVYRYYNPNPCGKAVGDCDSMMVPDRPNVNVPAWEAYRQALRDVPEQEGFPLSIVWPEKP